MKVKVSIALLVCLPGCLPIVQKYSSEVPNNIYDKKDCSFLRTKSKVAALSIAFDRMGLGSFEEQVIDSSWRADDVVGGIGCEGKQENDDQDDYRVDIVSEEGRLTIYVSEFAS